MKHLFTGLLSAVIILTTTLTLSAQRKKVGYYSETKDAGKFVPYDTGTYSYDKQNNIIKEQGLYYSIATKTWIPFYIYDYTYHTNNNLNYYDYTFFDGTQWNKLYRYIYAYDANNNVTQLITKKYKNAQLYDYEREEYTYNAQGLQTYILRYYVDSVGNFKQNFEQKNFVYNADNLLETEYSLLWNESKNGWDSSSRSTYSYNSNKQLEQLIYGRYFSTQNTWYNIQRINYEYDYEGLMRKWVLFSYTQNEVTNYGYTLYEFDGPLAIATRPLPTANVFPNPATQNTTLTWNNIDNATLEVRDLQGKVVFTQSNITNNSYLLNTSEIANGLYTYTIKPSNSNASLLTGRLVISK